MPMCRILVVEDTPIAREPLARVLRHEGYAVDCAGNGFEALAVLEGADASPPDVVLLDVMMPKMDGVRFLEAVRGHGRFRDLPVIVLTGSMDSGHLARVRALGVSDVLTKARFELEDLLTRIRSHAPAA